MKKITIETKIWEGDWQLVLKTNRLEKLFQRCQHPQSHKVIYVNNVNNIKEVRKSIENLINKGIIDDWVYVEEFADEALNFFDLKKNDFTSGYYYSISELVSIYLTKTEYLLHFSSDSIPMRNIKTSWIDECISTLDSNPQVKVCNLVWDRKYKEAKKESIREDDVFYYGYGFSDQMYLIKAPEFKKNIYKEVNEASKRYPTYGGELFEKRVDSWMRNYGYLRATYKTASYLHQNYPKHQILKQISVYLNQPTLFSK